MKQLVWALLAVLAFLSFQEVVIAQSLAEQKAAVTFIFGTVHPLNADKTPVKDAKGNPIELEMPLGTGFFVSYPDPRGGPDYSFVYLVTAKHVLRDFSGTFLPKLKLRLNLKSPSEQTGFDFITEVPVRNKNGDLLWFHTEKETDDLAVLPILPDRQKFDFKAIPISMFVDDASLKSDAVEEGDNLYFIGLMAQYYGSTRNYPVIRRGTLGLMTDEKISTPTGMQKVFIAQLESWPGNSGSPVLLNLGGLRSNSIYAGSKLRLLGILEGNFLNKIAGSVVGNPGVTMTNGNDFNTGISFIVPASHS